MAHQFFLYSIPLWALFIATLLLMGLAMEGGFRFGTLRHSRGKVEKDGAVGAMVGAMLGLLGFMLAITFGIAMSRFEARERAFLDEVDIISTTYLRADLLSEIHRDEMKKLLREYVDTRLNAVLSRNIQAGIAHSEELHERMWSILLAELRSVQLKPIDNLFIQSLNDLIDIHAKRVISGMWLRIPPTIWLVLYILTLLGMAEIGYQTALAGSSRSPASVGLIISFATLLWILADLDRPLQGNFRVHQRAMIELKEDLNR